MNLVISVAFTLGKKRFYLYLINSAFQGMNSYNRYSWVWVWFFGDFFSLSFNLSS